MTTHFITAEIELQETPTELQKAIQEVSQSMVNGQESIVNRINENDYSFYYR